MLTSCNATTADPDAINADQSSEPALHDTTHGAGKADAHGHQPSDPHDRGDQHGHPAHKTSAHGRSEHAAESHRPDDADRGTDKVAHVAIGDQVPNFEVTIDGKKWTLRELQKNTEMTADGTLMLTFWCSFCHSCRDVEKPLDAIAQEFKGKAAVIALDASAGETAEKVAEFATERELTLPIALDAKGTTPDVFGTQVTTTTVIIDGKGVLRYRGQFGNQQHPFARDALSAVLTGTDVPVEETRQKG